MSVETSDVKGETRRLMIAYDEGNKLLFTISCCIISTTESSVFGSFWEISKS